MVLLLISAPNWDYNPDNDLECKINVPLCRWDKGEETGCLESKTDSLCHLIFITLLLLPPFSHQFIYLPATPLIKMLTGCSAKEEPVKSEGDRHTHKALGGPGWQKLIVLTWERPEQCGWKRLNMLCFVDDQLHSSRSAQFLTPDFTASLFRRQTGSQVGQREGASTRFQWINYTKSTKLSSSSLRDRQITGASKHCQSERYVVIIRVSAVLTILNLWAFKDLFNTS